MGRYSRGLEQQVATAATLHRGRFSEGAELLPESRSKRRVGVSATASTTTSSCARRSCAARERAAQDLRAQDEVVVDAVAETPDAALGPRLGKQFGAFAEAPAMQRRGGRDLLFEPAAVAAHAGLVRGPTRAR